MQKPNNLPTSPGPIGVFDSGYGGLTILRKMRMLLPQYDYLYLGDNARAPYGTRSFDLVYEFTLQAIKALFERGCHLVILACNTASAKALRTIQHTDLPKIDPERRVLGVIRPTVEAVGKLTQNGHVGLMATPGTIRSHTYALELAKLSPDVHVVGQACPMWVPLVENHEAEGDGADYFVEKYLNQLFEKDPLIDSIILGCTHYPFLLRKILRFVPPHVTLIEQGDFVAQALRDYLQRHPDMEKRITRQGSVRFLTTEQAETFQANAGEFLKEPVTAERILLS